MTFLEAKDELKKLAEGKFHSIEYKLTEYKSGRLENECELYIDPCISTSGLTWREALDKMKQTLGIKTEVDLSEIPGEERGEDGIL
jgi:hypothetical protein